MSVSLDEIQNVVLLFSNPVWVGQDVQGPPDRSITALPSQIAYTDHVTDNLTVLASQYSQTPSGQIQGFLYVPELVTNDDCRQAAAQYVPKTAVRRNNLPPTNYNLIALAPWFNATCSRAYLSSARLDPLRAFMFYRPVNSTLAPAPPESEFWNIDGTLDWKTSLRFPVFALTGAAGSKMMRALSFYSGNLTEVPFGSTIMDNYDPDPLDYVRIWTALSISPDNDTPSFWILILAVLGVLVLVVATTSIAMHWTWRHRRLSLQKRVISGEVNLEAMGIKRLTVPMSHIQQFPLFTYHYAPDDEIQPATPGSPTASRSQLPTGGVTERRGSIHRKKSHTLSMSEKTDPTSILTTAVELSYQPTCHICLTDFRNRATIIRELSCGHIYHPDCIDEFLSEISSLCPLCKSSMVPRGSCPPITNSMVRRERAVRLLRGSISSSNPGSELGSEEGRVASWARGALARLRRARKGSSTFSLPRFAHPARARRKQHEEIKDVDHDGAMEMVESPVTPAPPAKTPAPPPPKQRRSQDEEFARRRMQELAGAEIESDDGQLPVWRKVQRTVFPGFG